MTETEIVITMPLQATIRARHLLSNDDIDRMYSLYCRYFSQVTEEQFRLDLDGKDWVILQRHEDGGLAGFSTACRFEVPVDGAPVRVLFSGDTVMARDARQSSTLAGAFGHLVRHVCDDSLIPVYWLLITKGYRTYRFLPVFFNEFYPVYDRATPAHHVRLLDCICRARFGSSWDPATGLLDFGPRHERLRPSMCAVPHDRDRDPHVRFFLEKNPRFAAGTELACIAPLGPRCFNRLGRRAIERTKVIWNV